MYKPYVDDITKNDQIFTSFPVLGMEYVATGKRFGSISPAIPSYLFLLIYPHFTTLFGVNFDTERKKTRWKSVRNELEIKWTKAKSDK